MPVEMRKTVYRESLVIPGSNVGQGVDFLLEQRNSRMKNYVIRNGIPTSDQWKAASASMQKLDKATVIYKFHFAVSIFNFNFQIIDVVEERLNLPMSLSKHKLDLIPSRKKQLDVFFVRTFHGTFDFLKKANCSIVVCNL